MPSTSGRQHRFFELIAHDPEAAKRLGVKQSVGREFVEADKAEGKHFAASKGEHPHRKLAEMLARRK